MCPFLRNFAWLSAIFITCSNVEICNTLYKVKKTQHFRRPELMTNLLNENFQRNAVIYDFIAIKLSDILHIEYT